MQMGEINIAQAADWHKQLRLAWQLDQVQVMLGSIFHWAVSTVAAAPLLLQLLQLLSHLSCGILGMASARLKCLTDFRAQNVA